MVATASPGEKSGGVAGVSLIGEFDVNKVSGASAQPRARRISGGR